MMKSYIGHFFASSIRGGAVLAFFNLMGNLRMGYHGDLEGQTLSHAVFSTFS